MAKKKINKLDALIFIDTNILLDFYRIRKINVSMKYLERIEQHKDLIITSSQIEMEYKKNRQVTILGSINEVKNINNISLSVPAIISDAKAVEMIKKSTKSIDEHKKRLKHQIEKILKNPSKYDPVYKSLQKIFKRNSPLNLNRENKIRFKIRDLAKKRFLLGYPPRKKTDNSFSDAINWEWIIRCAQDTDKHIILVTRDTDFGTIYESESYLNDWLCQEFKQRVTQKRKLILTDKLSTAFQFVKISVTKEMIEEEKNVINISLNKNSLFDLEEAFSRLAKNVTRKELQESFKQINKDLKLNQVEETFKEIKRKFKI